MRCWIDCACSMPDALRVQLHALLHALLRQPQYAAAACLVHVCGSRQACVISLTKICSICFLTCAMQIPQVCPAACCPREWSCWCCLRSRLLVQPLARADSATCKGCALLALLPASHLSMRLDCLCCRAGFHASTAGYLQGLVLLALVGAFTASCCGYLRMPSSALLSCEPGVLATCRGAVPQVNLSVLKKPVINSTLPTNVTTSNSTTLTFTTAKNTTTVICSSCWHARLALSKN